MWNAIRPPESASASVYAGLVFEDPPWRKFVRESARMLSSNRLSPVVLNRANRVDDSLHFIASVAMVNGKWDQRTGIFQSDGTVCLWSIKYVLPQLRCEDLELMEIGMLESLPR